VHNRRNSRWHPQNKPTKLLARGNRSEERMLPIKGMPREPKSVRIHPWPARISRENARNNNNNNNKRDCQESSPLLSISSQPQPPVVRLGPVGQLGDLMRSTGAMCLEQIRGGSTLPVHLRRRTNRPAQEMRGNTKFSRKKKRKEKEAGPPPKWRARPKSPARE